MSVGAVFSEEKVAFQADSSHVDRFLPRISVLTRKNTETGRPQVEKSFRPFALTDMTRVLDYDELPDPPDDTTMRFCEDAGPDGLKFPVRHVCVRGGFLFYFDVEDVDDHVDGHFVSYHAPPLGVVPLDKVDVALPPGGRRVFREHAPTDAKNGYEFVLIHVPDEGARGETRPAAFLVAESLALREQWVSALRMRADITSQDTKLRPNTSIRRSSPNDGSIQDVQEVGPKALARTAARKRAARLNAPDDDAEEIMQEKEMEVACKEFAVVDFHDDDWISEFFSTNNDFQAGAKIDELEQWQANIKRGLRGAVLEQYEYFVEASREMTTMGKEVASLKAMVESQNEIIKEMKEIDFTAVFVDGEVDSLNSEDDEMMDLPHLRPGGRKPRRRRILVTQQDMDDEDDHSDASSLSSDDGARTKQKTMRTGVVDDEEPQENQNFEIPPWLDDVSEEIAAFIKESRYSDATSLLFKAKNEVNETLTLHERPTDNKLTRKQHANLMNILSSLEALAERMSNRLVESLRRKNEALKQAGKRERADPHSLMAPMVSPCCLHDDLIPLQLLVKLGKTQEAATAYAARRSLLLLESLHERPISGTGNVDLVIYAAQLSQSFFSCLAGSVEGFLDLFLHSLEAGAQPHGLESDPSFDDQSLMTAASRNVPPGALASIVLWCDSELSKFSSAFGGTRILGNLALSPPPRQEVEKSKARMVGFEEESNQDSRERQQAVEVASQCVNQAFQYASENLDSIGLPLTPRLAEYVRSRLKGCEAEVARLLDTKWKHITYDWEIDMDINDIPMDERRGL